MIELYTGLPGAGKTLFAIDRLIKRAETEQRQVYYHGININNLDWIELEDPAKWYELPDGAIIVIDECQKLFRNRANGSAVPPYVAALETHRHHGHDLILITQHPGIIDSNVRRLVGLHFHIQRRFGFEVSTVFEYPNGVRDNPDKHKKDALIHKYKYNKKIYDYYKSSEIHTVQKRPPYKVFAIGLTAIAVCVLGIYYIVTYIKSKGEVAKNQTNQQTNEAKQNKQNQNLQVDVTTTEIKQPYSYSRDRRNQIPGLPQSAPIYQDIAKPKIMPYPASCVASPPKCTCYTQQATKIADMPKDLCMQIVKEGYFVDWQDDQPKQQIQQPKEPKRVFPADAQRSQMYDIPFTSTSFQSSLPDAKMKVR